MAELGLAIVPLCLGAIKVSGLVGRKLPALFRHDRELKRLRKKLKIQTGIFEDECQLLLQEIIDPLEAEAMVLDAHHSTWASEEFDCRMKKHLGRKYSDVCDVAKEIKDQINSIDTDIQGKYDNIDPAGNVKSPIRGREAADTFLHISDYDSAVTDLKESNEEFKRLRKAAAKIRKSQDNSRAIESSTLPQSFTRVSLHSRSFYGALKRFWSCLQAQHTRHEIRLLLASREDDSLRIIMRYHTQDTWEQRHGLVNLVVHSESMHMIKLSVPVPMSAPGHGEGSQRPCKARKVRFSEECLVQSSGKEGGSCTVEVQKAKMTTTKTQLNLCSEGDMCKQLCHQAQYHLSHRPEHESLPQSYLDAPDNVRHQLSPVCDPEDCISQTQLQDPIPLSQILDIPLKQALTVPQQLRLAANLVKGVLQFHSTPWLRDYWRLDDLSFFNTEEELADSLRTLHIANELSNPALRLPEPASPPHVPSSTTDIAMQDAKGSNHEGPSPTAEDFSEDEDEDEEDPSMLHARLTHGIRSLPLHSLGAALLSIGHWDCTIAANPEDVVRLRTLGGQHATSSPLGPEYHRAAQKCLDCDFGCGSDLAGNPALQAAVYTQVCRKLEGMARGLEERGREGERRRRRISKGKEKIVGMGDMGMEGGRKRGRGLMVL